MKSLKLRINLGNVFDFNQGDRNPEVVKPHIKWAKDTGPARASPKSQAFEHTSKPVLVRCWLVASGLCCYHAFARGKFRVDCRDVIDLESSDLTF